MVPQDAEEWAVRIDIDPPPPAVHRQFSDSGHAPYYGAVGRGDRVRPRTILLGPLGRHFKGAIHPHHFTAQLHLIARDFALVIDAELVAVEFAHHRKGDVIPVHLALPTG